MILCLRSMLASGNQHLVMGYSDIYLMLVMPVDSSFLLMSFTIFKEDCDVLCRILDAPFSVPTVYANQYRIYAIGSFVVFMADVIPQVVPSVGCHEPQH